MRLTIAPSALLLAQLLAPIASISPAAATAPDPLADGAPISRVSLTVDGDEANKASELPAISEDGEVVAFRSDATNVLGPGIDTNGKWDIFVLDRTYNFLSRVSVTSSGEQSTADCAEPSVSNDGRYVAFVCLGVLATTDTDNLPSVYLHDRQTGDTDYIAAGGGPYLSATGKYMVFGTNAALDADDTNNRGDIYRWERGASDPFVRASLTWDDGQISGTSEPVAGPSVSADGRLVVFDVPSQLSWTLSAGNRLGSGGAR